MSSSMFWNHKIESAKFFKEYSIFLEGIGFISGRNDIYKNDIWFFYLNHPRYKTFNIHIELDKNKITGEISFDRTYSSYDKQDVFYPESPQCVINYNLYGVVNIEDMKHHLDNIIKQTSDLLIEEIRDKKIEEIIGKNGR